MPKGVDVLSYVHNSYDVMCKIFGTRANVLGGEFNESGRQVIVLDPTLKIDEVDMSYKAFIEQYKGLILKKIIDDRNWTITKASNFLAAKFNFDPYVYSIMQRVIDEEHPQLILNRNPTITYGSILKMKIRKVKPDADDWTLAIPSAILPGQIAAHLLLIAGKHLCLTNDLKS